MQNLNLFLYIHSHMKKYKSLITKMITTTYIELRNYIIITVRNSYPHTVLQTATTLLFMEMYLHTAHSTVFTMQVYERIIFAVQNNVFPMLCCKTMDFQQTPPKFRENFQAGSAWETLSLQITLVPATPTKV